jgi:hypothetical protein
LPDQEPGGESAQYSVGATLSPCDREFDLLGEHIPGLSICPACTPPAPGWAPEPGTRSRLKRSTEIDY